MKILIKRSDGGVSILNPTMEATPETILRDVQGSRGYVSHREIDETLIPEDRTFRDAWTDDNPTPTIDVDMEKAREIQKDNLRTERQPLLDELDIEFMRAVESGDTALQKEISTKKQALRDITDHPDIENAKTPEELKQAGTEVING